MSLKNWNKNKFYKTRIKKEKKKMFEMQHNFRTETGYKEKLPLYLIHLSSFNFFKLHKLTILVKWNILRKIKFKIFISFTKI